jgi:hypothetical protein
MNITRHVSWKLARRLAGLPALLFTGALLATAVAAAPAQKTFGSPEDAAGALVTSLKNSDRSAMLAVLGNAGD